MATERLVIEVDEKGARIVSREIGKIGKEAVQASGGVNNLKAALGTLGVVAAIRQVLNLSDAFVELQNNIRLVTETEEQLRSVTKGVFEVSERTRTSVAANAKIFRELAGATKSLNLTQEEQLALLQDFNVAARLSGQTGQDAASGVLQLVQALSSGGLEGIELRPLLKNLDEVADVIAARLGVSKDALKLLAEQGKITSKVVVEAFQEVRGELADRFSRDVLPTISDRFEVLRNRIIEVVGSMESVDGLASAAGSSIKFLSDNAETLANVGLAAAIAGIAFLTRAVLPALTAALLANPFGVMVTALALAIANVDTLVAGLKKIVNSLVETRDLATQIQDVAAPVRTSKKVLEGLEREKRKPFAPGDVLPSNEVLAGLTSTGISPEDVATGPTPDPAARLRESAARLRGGLPEAIGPAGSPEAIQGAERANEVLDRTGVILKDLNKDTERALDLGRLSGLERVEREAALRRINELEGKGVDLSRADAQASIAAASAAARELAVRQEELILLEELGIASEKRAVQQEALNALLARGAITQEQYNAQLERQALVTGVASTLGEGLANTFLQIDTSAAALGESVGQSLVQGIDTASGALANFVLTGLRNVDDLKAAFSSLLSQLAQDIIKVIIQTLILNAIKSSLSGGGFFGIPGQQAGGPVSTGSPVIVGEQGPELFVPPSGGRIMPNGEVGQAAAPIINVINVQDPDEIASAIGGGAADESIINVIRRNRSALQGIV